VALFQTECFLECLPVFRRFGSFAQISGRLQAPGNRQTGCPRRHRQTHRHPAVLLFAHLSTILTADSDGMTALFSEIRCRPPPQQTMDPFFCIAGKTAWRTSLNKSPSLPRRIGHQMVQRLMHAAHILRGQTRRQWFHALAFHPATAIPCSSSAAAPADPHVPLRLILSQKYAENRFLLGSRRCRITHKKQFYMKLLVCNTVVLAARG